MAVTALLLLVACGGPQRELAKVEGLVTFAGQPVGEAVVLFRNQELGVHMTARVDADGTFRFVMAEGVGLPPGEYEVAVMPPPVEYQTGTPLPEAKPYENIPQRYRDLATSDLNQRVVAGENTVNIQMQP